MGMVYNLIEDVGQMRHLQTLLYWDFPAARMPGDFPHSLRTVSLFPFEWQHALRAANAGDVGAPRVPFARLQE